MSVETCNISTIYSTEKQSRADKKNIILVVLIMVHMLCVKVMINELIKHCSTVIEVRVLISVLQFEFFPCSHT